MSAVQVSAHIALNCTVLHSVPITITIIAVADLFHITNDSQSVVKPKVRMETKVQN